MPASDALVKTSDTMAVLLPAEVGAKLTSIVQLAAGASVLGQGLGLGPPAETVNCVRSIPSIVGAGTNSADVAMLVTVSVAVATEPTVTLPKSTVLGVIANPHEKDHHRGGSPFSYPVDCKDSRMLIS